MTDTTKGCVERLAKRAEAAAVEYRTRFPCCGERDTLGTCAAPACHFGEVLNGLTRQAKALRDLVKERDALAAEVAALTQDIERAQACIVAEHEARVAAEAEAATLRQRDAAMRAALIAAKEASEFAVAVSAATPDGEAIEPQLASKAEWMFVKAQKLRDAALSAAPPPSALTEDQCVEWIAANLTAIRRDSGAMEYTLRQVVRAMLRSNRPWSLPEPPAAQAGEEG